MFCGCGSEAEALEFIGLLERASPSEDWSRAYVLKATPYQSECIVYILVRGWTSPNEQAGCYTQLQVRAASTFLTLGIERAHRPILEA